jgi:hypothetical protein
MTTLDDLDLFDQPDGPRPGAAPVKPCRHPKALRVLFGDGTWQCSPCGHLSNAETQRRGRNNRARGNAIEREIARSLGLRRVGQFGGPEDVAGELFVAQVKSGGAFPERLWQWLKAVPATAAQTPLLVVTDAPGPGHRRRALVILELHEWAAWHGGDR